MIHQFGLKDVFHSLSPSQFYIAIIGFPYGTIVKEVFMYAHKSRNGQGIHSGPINQRILFVAPVLFSRWDMTTMLLLFTVLSRRGEHRKSLSGFVSAEVCPIVYKSNSFVNIQDEVNKMMMGIARHRMEGGGRASNPK
jgi:hypothetical protein